MKITLKQLKLSFFKGVKSLDMNFSEETNIHGRNEAGKTTLFDSIWYLFFGKDSKGRADFAIKTLDADNNPIEKVNHEVHGFFEIDGTPRDFKRTYLQKWDKKTDILKGHTTEFAIDGFPVPTKTDYDKQVSEFFTEETFKVVTNPLFFNSLKTEEKRAILLKLAPNITDAEVLAILKAENPKDKSFQTLEDILAIQKDFAAIKLKAQRERKALEEEKARIPQRIDENMRNMPQVEDWEVLESIVAEKTKEIQSIDAQISDVAERERKLQQLKLDNQTQIFDLKRKVAQLESEAKQKASDHGKAATKGLTDTQAAIADLLTKKTRINNDLALIESRIERGKNHISELKRDKDAIAEKLANLRETFAKKSAEQFTLKGNCPYCGSKLAEVANYGLEKETEFNQTKEEELNRINKIGKTAKENMVKIENDIIAAEALLSSLEEEKNTVISQLEATQNEISALDVKLSEMKANPLELPDCRSYVGLDYTETTNLIMELESKVFPATEGISELSQKKRELQEQINLINKSLHNKGVIEQLQKRNDELNQELKNLSAKIVEAEGLERAIKAFSIKRIGLVEQQINSKFEIVKWKMFEQNLSNDDVTEICECLKDGVPWPSLNNAGQIQAGLDIIRTFNRFYNLYLPVFIDNRESVTNIPKMETQIINLIVDPKSETLTIK